MIQRAKRVAIYARVSTADQSAERQIRDLRAHAAHCGYKIIAEVTETASGAKDDRKQRAVLIEMARKRSIDAILVTELTRWGRSTTDVINTMQQLSAWGVSLIAQTGLDFDLDTPTGKLMLTILAGISEFERDLLRERVMSGLANAQAKGKKLGRPKGIYPTDRYAPEVMKHFAEGRSVRWIAREMQLSPNTVQDIKNRHVSKQAQRS